jgi:hypothetical protein
VQQCKTRRACPYGKELRSDSSRVAAGVYTICIAVASLRRLKGMREQSLPEYSAETTV